MKRKLLIGLCIAMLAMSLVACDAEQAPVNPVQPEQPQQPQEPTGAEAKALTGKAKGYAGLVTATITVEGDKIIAVDVQGNDETKGIGTNALEKLPSTIVAAGNTNVDAVAGATVTSKAIIAAVNNALDPVKYPYVEEEAVNRKEVPMTADSLKLGFGSAISLADSVSAGEKAGNAQVNAIVAAVTVDNNGKIVECKIDGTDASIGISNEGKILVESDVVHVKAKSQLNDAAWNKQVSAVEASVVGKTLAEVKQIAADSSNKDFLYAVVAAVEGAKSLGAKVGDKLGLGVVNEIVYDKGSHTRDATAEKVGQAQGYASYTALTVNKDGVITSAIIDSSQGNVNFDTKGVITSDIISEVPTKIVLRDKYGMRGRSGIGKEYFEQVFALADYVTGKTAAEVTGMPTKDGRPSDVDLASSVTIGIANLQEVTRLAVENAK